MNKPYRKVHVDGFLINPVTKESPYVNTSPNRSSRRKRNVVKNNSAGARINIIPLGYGKFMKYTLKRFMVGGWLASKGAGKIRERWELS
jgi:hypothetical protein